jgi:transcriptional regulator with XRE-family HTH domain
MAKSAPAGFGEWVRARRECIELSLREFALQTGLDPGNLSKYERGLLPPPQDEKILARIASALRLKKGAPKHREFMDLAAASAGRIPPDIASDPRLVRRLPLLFRTARGSKLTRDQLIQLADRLKNL